MKSLVRRCVDMDSTPAPSGRAHKQHGQVPRGLLGRVSFCAGIVAKDISGGMRRLGILTVPELREHLSRNTSPAGHYLPSGLPHGGRKCQQRNYEIVLTLKVFRTSQSLTPVAYTAKEIAALTHISNKQLAKTVIVKIDSKLAMAVLPASYEVDLSSLRAAAGARSVSLAKESGF